MSTAKLLAKSVLGRRPVNRTLQQVLSPLNIILDAVTNIVPQPEFTFAEVVNANRTFVTLRAIVRRNGVGVRQNIRVPFNSPLIIFIRDNFGDPSSGPRPRTLTTLEVSIRGIPPQNYYTSLISFEAELVEIGLDYVLVVTPGNKSPRGNDALAAIPLNKFTTIERDDEE